MSSQKEKDLQESLDKAIDEIKSLNGSIEERLMEQKRDRDQVLDFYIEEIEPVSYPYHPLRMKYERHFGLSRIEILKHKNARSGSAKSNEKLASQNGKTHEVVQEFLRENRRHHNILGGQVRVFNNPDDFKAFVREQFPKQAEKMVEQIDAAFSEKPINEPDRKLTDDHIIKGMRKMSEDIVAVCEAINSLSDRIKAMEERKHW